MRVERHDKRTEETTRRNDKKKASEMGLNDGKKTVNGMAPCSLDAASTSSTFFSVAAFSSAGTAWLFATSAAIFLLVIVILCVEQKFKNPCRLCVWFKHFFVVALDAKTVISRIVGVGDRFRAVRAVSKNVRNFFPSNGCGGLGVYYIEQI